MYRRPSRPPRGPISLLHEESCQDYLCLRRKRAFLEQFENMKWATDHKHCCYFHRSPIDAYDENVVCASMITSTPFRDHLLDKDLGDAIQLPQVRDKFLLPSHIRNNYTSTHKQWTSYACQFTSTVSSLRENEDITQWWTRVLVAFDQLVTSGTLFEDRGIAYQYIGFTNQAGCRLLLFGVMPNVVVFRAMKTDPLAPFQTIYKLGVSGCGDTIHTQQCHRYTGLITPGTSKADYEMNRQEDIQEMERMIQLKDDNLWQERDERRKLDDQRNLILSLATFQKILDDYEALTTLSTSL
jgi:hypothetical protein